MTIDRNHFVQNRIGAFKNVTRLWIFCKHNRCMRWIWISCSQAERTIISFSKSTQSSHPFLIRNEALLSDSCIFRGEKIRKRNNYSIRDEWNFVNALPFHSIHEHFENQEFLITETKMLIVSISGRLSKKRKKLKFVESTISFADEHSIPQPYATRTTTHTHIAKGHHQ